MKEVKNNLNVEEETFYIQDKIKTKSLIKDWEVFSEEEALNPKYKQWRSKCLFRDKWRCRICGSRKKLSVHHLTHLEIIVKSKQFHLLWDIDNGITLCKECHKDIHFAEDILEESETFINEQCIGKDYDDE